ncbi:copper chaperone CopZ [Mycobacterium sp. BK558]|jgi:copper chaperone CopZ|uniref:Copper chaperone CopZ n=1 Tax=Mycolicibacterium chlorophenolicum TaxID=37916 RepID=A0A0J6VBS3_9MYCO|nr:heavy metal-associated domain-containing protein [Mycolicibacterium chlorophenolicum]KMO67167.1 Copper chaperone CopZ [Mycolicibacterium chlorophenolicum]MBI5338086.1 heavy-metal-associated domain-containing protein [Mycolicibacterium rufum]RZT26177.1 copper chaperone CopZ [Mycobacterium sp. BK558]
MTTTTISVEGMTCGGCANSVRAELSHIPGVHDVDIDLSHGTVTIASDAPIVAADLRSAIEEAGYQLAS